MEPAKEPAKAPAPSAAPAGDSADGTATPSLTSPRSSPPASPPAAGDERRRSRTAASPARFSSPRPKFDRLGNPLPDRRPPGSTSSAYGAGGHFRLPGDLGANDPRRPRSPAPAASPAPPAALPGDLGPNDPRRPSSPAPPRPSRPPHVRQLSAESSDGSGRLEEDPPLPGQGDEHGDSDNDADADNDNDTDRDEDGKPRGRGRKRPEPGTTTSGKSVNVRDESADSEADWRGALKPDPTKGQSRFSFAPRSDPRITVTPPSDRKNEMPVHPTTAFDLTPSGTATPMESDDETHEEFRAAQKLSLTMSPIHSTPSAHRVIRQIIRGDYAQFQREAEQGRKRQRMYLVATDLSPESEYALEWTIGTVLRDGDTLFAVYASDLESVPGAGTSTPGGLGGASGHDDEPPGGVEIGAGADSVKDTAAIVRGLPATNVVPSPAPSPAPSLLAARSGAASSEASSMTRGTFSAAETERRRAIEDISQRCMYLLRKTRLQVRVVVEVFHCKSPRHMITEVIDFLTPTLVIIGSRGRSAVKGVLLGSFSNYLVTKSSVPVMVARKKLRKHSKSVRRNRDGTSVPYSGSGRTGRFSNVIEAPRARGLRVQGWDKVGID